ncbi:MAG: hypothetical protein M3R16_03605 [Pseudomonadota bacterium]|nr:hypothetical protein [Pseudomonadota bacterium]
MPNAKMFIRLNTGKDCYTCEGCEREIGEAEMFVHDALPRRADGYERVLCSDCLHFVVGAVSTSAQAAIRDLQGKLTASFGRAEP